MGAMVETGAIPHQPERENGETECVDCAPCAGVARSERKVHLTRPTNASSLRLTTHGNSV